MRNLPATAEALLTCKLCRIDGLFQKSRYNRPVPSAFILPVAVFFEKKHIYGALQLVEHLLCPLRLLPKGKIAFCKQEGYHGKHFSR